MTIDASILVALPSDVPSAALTYVDAGFRVLITHGVRFDDPELDGEPACTCPDPQRNGQPGGSRCASKGKHPARGKWQVGRASASHVQRWYAELPAGNVGLAMGGDDRLIAIDIDGAAGRASLAELEAKHGALPRTLASASGREDGGEHRIFVLPAGFNIDAVKNRAGMLGKGVDVRAEGGQIVVAPSLHASGSVYRWTCILQPAVLPEAWAKLLTVDGEPARLPTAVDPGEVFVVPDRYAAAALERACAALVAAPKGGRNDAANREGWSVGRVVGAGLLGREPAESALLAAMRRGGWDDCAVNGHNAATLRNGLDSGAEDPIRPPPLRPSAPQSTKWEYVSSCKEQGTHEPQPPADIPVIRIREPELQRMTCEAIDSLATHDPNLYQRAGELVTIVREPDRLEPNCADRTTLAEGCPTCRAVVAQPCARDRRTGGDVALRPGTPRLRAVSAPVLLERMSVCARWTRWDERVKEHRHVAPPSRIASIVHALDREKPGVRPIRGILESPSLRPDGTVIDRAGYDDATGYVYLPSVDFPTIPANPSQQDAAVALRRLWIELCCDFPFRGLGEVPADWRVTDPARFNQYERARAVPDAFVGLAALLTIIARPAILGAVPGVVFEAATQGSGKTLQIHAISVAATGRPAGVMTFPASRGEPNEEELEKVLSAYALASSRIVAFDNVKATLGGPALEKVLTVVDSTDFRMLGSTEMRTLPWSAVVLFSGNNLTMTDDVAQRTLMSRLESPREDPRSRPSRDFYRADLLASVAVMRPQLVTDALTVLRAYCSALASEPVDDARGAARGALQQAGILGSFEAWSRLIPPAIVYAAGPLILEARPKSGGDSNDSEAEAHLTLMRQWPSEDAIKASDLLHMLFDAEYDQARGKAPPDGRDDVRAAVRTLARTADGKAPNGAVFGKALARLRGKIRGGMRVECKTDRQHMKLWSVVDPASDNT